MTLNIDLIKIEINLIYYLNVKKKMIKINNPSYILSSALIKGDINISDIIKNQFITCPICYDDFKIKNMIQFNCKHSCCRDCLNKYRKANKNKSLTCPECRNNIDKKIINDNCSFSSVSSSESSELEDIDSLWFSDSSSELGSDSDFLDDDLSISSQAIRQLHILVYNY